VICSNAERPNVGDYEAAASLFAASSREAPQAGTLLLLGEAYEHLGKLESAHATYRRAEELADREQDAALAHAAHTRGAAVLPRVARLEIRIALPLPRGLLVTLNGVEVPDIWLNGPVPLDDGEYRLEAFAPGHEPFTMSLQVASRHAQPGPQVAPVALVASRSVAAAGPIAGGGAASSAAQPERDTGGFDQRQLAWWLGGVGAGAAVVTGIIVLIAQSRYSGANCSEETDVCQTQEDVDDRGSAIMLANIATATTVVSAAGLGVGLSLYFTADDPEAGTGATIGWTGNF
jgi:hypothetical protein